jgi:hypothetical protein
MRGSGSMSLFTAGHHLPPQNTWKTRVLTVPAVLCRMVAKPTDNLPDTASRSFRGVWRRNSTDLCLPNQRATWTAHRNQLVCYHTNGTAIISWIWKVASGWWLFGKFPNQSSPTRNGSTLTLRPWCRVSRRASSSQTEGQRGERLPL